MRFNTFIKLTQRWLWIAVIYKFYHHKIEEPDEIIKKIKKIIRTYHIALKLNTILFRPFQT